MVLFQRTTTSLVTCTFQKLWIIITNYMNYGQIKLWELLLALTDIKCNVVRRPQIRLPRMRCAFRLRAHTRLCAVLSGAISWQRYASSKVWPPTPALVSGGTLVDCASVDRYPPAASSSRGYTLLHLPLTLEGAWRPLDDLQLPTTPPNSLPLSAVRPGSSDATFPNRVPSKVDKVNIKP